ncbi:MAG: hypothetical protein ACFE8N_02050 [Promethearchaeota archaeon]
MLDKLNPSLREPLFVYGAGAIITILSIIFFSIMGYPLVKTATSTLSIYTPPIYMISVFFPYGILLGEALWLWNEKKENYKFIILTFECIVVGILAFIRFVINIPFSGHAIILFFFLFYQVSNNRIRYPLRFIIGILVLIITMIFKIFLWGDPTTFFLGGLLGIALWLPGFLFRLKKGFT